MTSHQNVTFRNHPVTYKFFSLIMACALILNTRSIWLSTSNGTRLSNGIFLVFILSGAFFIFYVKSINILFLRKIFLPYIFMTIYMVFYMILPNNSLYISSILKLYASFTVIYLYIYIYSQSKGIPLMLKYYIDCMCIIGMISLFFWIFGSFLHIIKPTGSIISYWSGVNGVACNSYYGIYFETQYLTSNLIRNSAIFTEAPMSAINFLMALALQSLYNTDDKMHKFKETLLVLSLLSTTSTTGYIGLLIIYILKYLLSAINKKNFLQIIIFAFLGIVGVIVIHSLFTQKLGDMSGEVRLDDYRAGFKAWKLYPILGSGYNSTLAEQFMSNWRSNGFSNTVMNILVDGGIYLLIPYAYTLCKAIYNAVEWKNKNIFIFSVLTTFIFMTTILTNTYILFFMFTFIYVYSDSEYKS